MKKCELCGGVARMYCESDQAILCWDCDRKVHGANFLVAKHTRSLLCHACQRPTMWRASGLNLGQAISACDSCVNVESKAEERIQDSEDCEEDEDSSDFDDEEEEEEEIYSDDEDDCEDEDNQVVPWSVNCSSAPPATTPDSSRNSDDEAVSGIAGIGACFGSKRIRENQSDCSDDEIDYSSSHLASGESPSRALKQRKLDESIQSAGTHESDSKSTDIISSLQKIQKQIITNNVDDASSSVLEICRLSRDQNH